MLVPVQNHQFPRAVSLGTTKKLDQLRSLCHFQLSKCKVGKAPVDDTGVSVIKCKKVYVNINVNKHSVKTWKM